MRRGLAPNRKIQLRSSSLLCLLASLGICMNMEKFTDSQTIDLIGAILALTSARACLLMDRFEAMSSLISHHSQTSSYCQGLSFPTRQHSLLYLHNAIWQASSPLPNGLALVFLLDRQYEYRSDSPHQCQAFPHLVDEPRASVC